MSYRAGVIGYPIEHTISPAFQQAALDHYGIDATYEAWETQPDAMQATFDWLRRTPRVWGANVTVPHKEAAFALVDTVDSAATALGAVNTVVVQEERLTGYNTDVDGFLRALTQDGNFQIPGARVLLLGAGGAARAVIAGLAQSDVAHITVANRRIKRAESLAGLGASLGVTCRVEPLSSTVLTEGAGGRSWDLIVNTTSVGMVHGPAEGSSPMDAAGIPPGALVFDLVYNPLMTPLLMAAESVGAKVLTGLPMLVYQGAASFQLWTGREAPVEVMMEAAKKRLSELS